MARAASFAQHYIECENCEEKPAQYLCKTCAGHLCETCKTEHEKRKITKNHEIFHLTSDKGEGMELLYCSEHTTKKLDCYCSPCQKPICIKCLMETHNGHPVENLATVYNRIKKELENERVVIETSLLPKYKELLSKENIKKAEILKRTNEEQRQIEDHTQKIIRTILMIKERRVQDLRGKEQYVLKMVDDVKHELGRRIENLEKTTTQINNNLGANPGITFFQTIDCNKVNEMRKFPREFEYRLQNFHAGNIDIEAWEKDFGDWPEFAMEQLDKSLGANPGMSSFQDMNCFNNFYAHGTYGIAQQDESLDFTMTKTENSNSQTKGITHTVYRPHLMNSVPDFWSADPSKTKVAVPNALLSLDDQLLRKARMSTLYI